MAIAAAVGAVTVATASPAGRGLVAGGAVLGAGSVALGVAGRWPWAIGAGVAVLGAGFVAGHGGDDVARAVVPVAGGLLASAELAFWSMELATPVEDRAGVHRPRWAWLAGVTGLAVAAATMLVAVAGARVQGGVALDGVAVVAAVGLIALAAALAARRRPPPSGGATGG